MKNVDSKQSVNYDSGSDVLYIGVQKGIEEEFVEVAPGVNVELNKDRKVIGVEILNASQVLSPIARRVQSQKAGGSA